MATAWVFACDNPQPPVPCGSVPEQTITVGESATVTLCFDDPNGEMLAHTVVSSDPGVATAVAAGSTVTVTAVSPGVAVVTMIATDPTGLKAQQSFRVVVPNRPPSTVGTIPDRELMVGDSATLDVSGYFSEPDGQGLGYAVAVSDSSRLTAAVEGTVLTIVADAKGDVVVTVTATDPGGLSATQSFLVTVPNRPPVPVDSIAARVVEVGTADTVDVSPFFMDPDGDSLSYAAAVSDSALISASVSGSTVVVTARAKGEVEVTVTATDDEGLSAEQRFAVTVPNRPPLVSETIAARTIFRNEADTLTLARFFTDPDGDALTWGARASDGGVVALDVSSAQGTLAITAVGQGEATVTVTATDPEGLAAEQSFLVTVPNRGPVVAEEIPAQTLYQSETAPLDLGSHFSDPDGDVLTYTAETTNSGVARPVVAGTLLTIEAEARGEATITVTATDPGGLSASQSFTVTVPNRAPTATDPIPEQTIQSGQPTTIDLSAHFADPDGDPLVYTARASSSTVVGVSVQGATVTLRARAKGTTRVSVTATDPGGLTAEQSFAVTVANRAPTAVGRLPDLTIVRDENRTLRISGYFSDPDGDALNYSAATADPAIARVSVSGASLTVTGVTVGETTLTLTATDPGGLTATQTSQLRVINRRGSGGFSLSIEYLSSATSAVRTAVDRAAARWESILSATDFADATANSAFTCTLRGVSYTVSVGTFVDDIVIAVGAGEIDGSESPSVAASAGLCATRTGSNTPAIGVIVFDSADLDQLERLGLLTSVALHEIGHILGIGQTSSWSGLVRGTSDPHFTGTRAVAAFNAAGGRGYSGAKVPVQSSDDTAHWRESVLGLEIMTPSLRSGATNPLSAITVQALADMGYSVNTSLTDSFTLASGDAADIAGPAPTVYLHGDFVGGPVVMIDEDGNVVRVIPGAEQPSGELQRPPQQTHPRGRR
ncbi:MAG: hypothetical protein OXH49_16980 [Gemmatimonadetes bacterium]|nr:hypothetical protein [Gemmatimonadota bacterium]